MILTGDCVEVMAGMEPASVDAIVCDPPYGLGEPRSVFNLDRAMRNGRTDEEKVRRGFMGKAWDGTGIAFDPRTWAACLRVAKPGAYLLAFGGTRTVHRMTCAIEDAGWVVRDVLIWCYASGFPKSRASLKPAYEPIVMARKPGLAAPLQIDRARIVSGPTSIMDAWENDEYLCSSCAEDADFQERPGAPATRASTTPRRAVQMRNGWGTSTDTGRRGIGCSGGTTAASSATSSSTAESGKRRMARSPMDASSTTSTATGETTGSRTCLSCGSISTRTTTTDDTTSTPTGQSPPTTSDGTEGRWPSNVLLTSPIFDGGWDGVVGGGASDSPAPYVRSASVDSMYGGDRQAGHQQDGYGDSGTYSRFFLVPKSSRSDREPLVPPEWFEDGKRANSHPTCKPTALMRHLVRLVTPPGGTVLDPFLGSGTTAIACEMEGFPWIGIEKEPEYVAIAEARLAWTQRGMGLDIPAPTPRRSKSVDDKRSPEDEKIRRARWLQPWKEQDGRSPKSLSAEERGPA